MSAAVRWLCAAAALALGEAAAFAAGSAPCGAWPAPAAAAIPFFILAVPPAGDGGRPRRTAAFAWLLCALFLSGFALAQRELNARRDAMDAFACIAAAGGTPLEVEIPQSAYIAPGRHGGTYISFSAPYGPLTLAARYETEAGAPAPAPGETWRFSVRPAGREDVDLTKRIPCRTDSARRVSGAAQAGAGGLARRLRADLSRRAGVGLEAMPAEAAMLRAMLLGERSAMDRASRRAFADAGTIHVFAISGLHVVVVAHVFFVLLLCCGFTMRGASVALAPAVWAYAWIAGASPSAMRAAAMATLCCIAPAAWRRPDAIVAWAATFVAFHLFRPAMLFNTGSLLSFSVMLAIAAWLRWAPSFHSRFADAFAVTVVAWAAGAPIVAAVFGRFAAGGILANIIAMPAASAAIVSGFLGILASFVSDWAAAHFNAAAAAALSLVEGVSRTVAATPLAGGEIMPWSLAACIAWYLALFAVAAAVSAAVRRSRRFLS